LSEVSFVTGTGGGKKSVSLTFTLTASLEMLHWQPRLSLP